MEVKLSLKCFPEHIEFFEVSLSYIRSTSLHLFYNWTSENHTRPRAVSGTPYSVINYKWMNCLLTGDDCILSYDVFL